MAKFIIAVIVFIAIALAACLATLSAAHWYIQLEGQPDWVIACAVIGSVCVSLLVMASAWLLGRGYSKALIAVIVILAGADTYQNGAGFQTVSGLTVSGEVEAAQARLDAARADLAALPMPDATGAIRKASTWETVNTTLTQRVEAAKADLVSVSTPKAADGHVMAVMALIQLALALLFRALGKGGKEISQIANSGAETGAKKGSEEITPSAPNVVHLRPARMDEKDMRTWAKIAKV